MPVSPRSGYIRIIPVLLGFAMLVHGVSAQAREPEVRNSLGMAFVLIPPGEFIMGSPSDEPYRDESEPPHPVVLTRPFYMQTTEVTFAQWQALMGRGLLLRWSGPEELPVTEVSWHDVQAFLEKLNDLGEGRYRLPTEAEWEYAARAGSTTAYSWGERIDCSLAMFANSRYGTDTCLDAHPDLPAESPAPVGSFAPNDWGLYDMHGNVWEWVQDWFAPYPSGRQTDPQGPPGGAYKVRRSGSWYGPGYFCRSANRAYSHPATREITIGFRVVRIVEP